MLQVVLRGYRKQDHWLKTKAIQDYLSYAHNMFFFVEK